MANPAHDGVGPREIHRQAIVHDGIAADLGGDRDAAERRGIYGVISYIVVQRRGAIGVREELGEVFSVCPVRAFSYGVAASE